MRQRTALRDHGHGVAVQHHLSLPVFIDRQPGFPDEAQVDLVLGERLELLGHRQVEQVERHVRPHLAKTVEGGWQQVVVHVGDVADVQRAIFTQAKATHVLHVGARLGQQAPGTLQKETSSFRQGELVVCPGEELHAQLPFQISDLAGERGLGEPQFEGRAGHAQLLGHRDKVVQVTNLDERAGNLPEGNAGHKPYSHLPTRFLLLHEDQP